MSTPIIVRDATSGLAITPYSPAQIKTAYNYDFDEQGEGVTIAIVDAYGNPNMENDLEVFNERFNLPSADFEVIYPQGVPPVVDEEWQIETALDVEWAHAMAPKAKIILVAALDPTFDNLKGAIIAAIQAGADIVSMSFGAIEQEDVINSYEPIFQNANIAFCASSGDADNVSYPATSPSVIGVGGTSMQLNGSGGRVNDELGWYFSGGGISGFFRKPQYQYIKNNAQPQTDLRTSPDVSFFADSFPGVNLYFTPVNETDGIWLAVGGTSVSSPCFAGVLACALPMNMRYKNAPELMYKVAENSSDLEGYIDVKNGNTPFYPAIEGYDYVTGLGSPNIRSFIELVRYYLNKDDC